MNGDGSKTIRAILIAPEQWQPERDAYVPGFGPDPFAIYEEMRKFGVDVQLIDPSDAITKFIPGRHPLYTGLDPTRAWKLLTKFRAVDLLLSVFESPCTLPLLLRKITRYPPKIAMWDIVPEKTWFPRKFLQGLTIPRADCFFVLSRFHNEYLQREYGRSGRVIWQHVDADFYQPSLAEPRGPILAIGEDSGRDFETFLEAVSDLDVEVVLKTRRFLALKPSRARVFQIKEHLNFVELRNLYAMASIVVVPLHNTLNASGVGSILEAMAMAKPLVVSDNPPIRDYVIPEQTALVVPTHDAIELRKAICALLCDPQKAASLGAAARELVNVKFAKPAFARRMAHEIRRLVMEA